MAYGKQSRNEDYPVRGRGGKGVIAIQMSARNGALIGAVQVFDGDEVILISDQGTLDDAMKGGKNKCKLAEKCKKAKSWCKLLIAETMEEDAEEGIDLITQESVADPTVADSNEVSSTTDLPEQD